MINGASLCLVSACPRCSGRGELSRSGMASNAGLPGTGYGGPLTMVPCPECNSGFLFRALDELDLLRHLIRLLNSDQQYVNEKEHEKLTVLKQLRQEFRKVFVKSTEEQIVDTGIPT